MTPETLDKIKQVEDLMAAEKISAAEACKKLGIKGYYDAKSKLKKKRQAEQNVALPFTKQKEKPKRAYTKRVPQLITIPTEKRKESVTIMMGDPDEIAKILERAGKLRG